MLEVLSFILSFLIDFLKMLFRIDVGFTNLGTVLCIVYILLPTMLFIVNFLKSSVLHELDERYDESRPTEEWTSTEHQFFRSPGSTRDYGKSFTTNHVRIRRRRY